MENLKKKIQTVSNLYQAKELGKAETLCKNLLISHPDVVFLYNLMGLILADQKKIDVAENYYKKGIKINPNFALIYNNLASIYKYKQKYKEAESNFKKSIKLDSSIPEPCNNLGNLYVYLNKYDEGIHYYNRALDINPKFFIAHYNLGVAFKAIGKIEEAKKHLKESVRINPLFCTGHRNLSIINKYKKDDEHFKILKEIINKTEINNPEKSELAFALGKAYEDLNDYKKSFMYYDKGNKLRRKNVNFSINDTKSEFRDIKECFNKKFFDKNKEELNNDKTPIFIVGMPRSGTTLIEQIISNHPKVYAGDELNFLQNLYEKHFRDENGDSFKNLQNFDNKDFKKISKEYINNLKEISNNSERVTDKLPINFKLIGLIKLILPNSKIIHCVRNPKDVCFSIYKNYFINRNLNFAYNLDEIVEYYILYNDLMSHWKSVVKDFVIDVKYEELTSNPEIKIKNLLKKCNLTWNINCLKFYENKRPIKTASDAQVRKKIYKSSINSWKNFEDNLINYFSKLPD